MPELSGVGSRTRHEADFYRGNGERDADAAWCVIPSSSAASVFIYCDRQPRDYASYNDRANLNAANFRRGPSVFAAIIVGWRGEGHDGAAAIVLELSAKRFV